MSKHPAGFIENLSIALKERELLPMWGKMPPFPWNTLESSLKGIFSCDDLKLSQNSCDWKEYGEFLKGLGEDPAIISCALTPLNPPFFLAISKEDIETLTAPLLDQKDEKKSFTDTDYLNGFFRFLVLKVLSDFNEAKVFADLSAKMNNAGLKSEPGYCVDITINHPKKALHGRAIFPESFHRVVSSHFMDMPLSKNILQTINPTLPLSLSCGHVSLSIGQWESVKVGDFIVLDSCSYNPSKQSGSLRLNFSDQGLLLVHLKNQQIKIIDYALYDEEYPMSDQPEDGEESPTPEENELPEENKSFEESFEEEGSEEEEELSFEDDGALSEKLLAAQDVPIEITVEVSRLKMPLKNLLSLKPGNTFEVSAKPEASVTLTVSGKAVGRGQLVQIGDAVGVKITEVT